MLIHRNQEKGNYYITAVPAKDLAQWCDVPRSKSAYMAGYQRALSSKRTENIKQFLNESKDNFMPGAVIVSVDSEAINISQDGREIQITEDNRDFDTKLLELFGQFTTRLNNTELGSAGVDFSVPNQEDSEEEFDDDNTPPQSYIAALVEELNSAIQDWDSIPSQRQTSIGDYINGLSKPGLIIDGQHRVFGACEVESDIILPVVLIPGLEHSEQVFQFYVLNSKARPLRPTELRRNISTSLTNQEIQELYNRFKQAKVDAEEARWTYEMQTREESPFAGLIDMGFGVQGTVIKENVADQVVRRFMRMPRRYNKLYSNLGETWSNKDNRLHLFFWFWNAISTHYEAVWSDAIAAAKKDNTQNQIFMKVALLTLQEFTLDRILNGLDFMGSDSPPPFSSQESTKNAVVAALNKIPSEFYTREWKMKQLDTTEGRKNLYSEMDKVVKAGKIHGNMKLFKG